METLKMHWLGTPLVELKGRAVKLETRKVTALLAYLSLQPRECSRETLAAMFWPEKDQTKALGNLRRALASLNTSLTHWIEADRGAVSLKRENPFWLDIEAFHKALTQAQEHTHPPGEMCDECLAHLNMAVDSYRGDFLEGMNLNDCPSFDDWQLIVRDGLRQEMAGALQRICTALTYRKDWEPAIASARRWLAMDRLHEPACRLLMEVLAASGQKAAALRQYGELERLLADQMGQDPETETRELFQQLRGVETASKTIWPAPSAASFPLLRTKLFIPVRPASRVIRSELVERMHAAARKPLTLISAPAGFGKTTLLAEWIAQTSLPVAWLSLDQGDNDPYRFLAYLIAALESLKDEVGAEAQKLMQTGQQVPLHILLAALINELAKASEPMVLVLDDAQSISNSSVNEALAYLLDHLPANLHLIISTRADPPLQLGRMRANDQLLELRMQDLRFTAEETAQFLNRVMRLGLSTENMEALQLRTEGWVVGLKMAALSLNQREDAGEFIRAFSGSQRYVLDYLVEEVLRRQPENIQEFLLKTSILDKLSGLLCDHVINRAPGQTAESGQAVLEYLERSNLFVMPLDDHKHWYRYHQLFSELLRMQLQRNLDAQGAAELHIRASDWYEQNGSLYEAIHHASLARDEARIERLIEASYQDMVRRGEMLGLRYWAGKLSKELVFRRPWLCIYEAYSHAWFGELDKADVFLEAAERRLQSEPSSPETDSMAGHLIYVKCRVTAMRGDLSKAIEFNLAARKHLPPNNEALRLDLGITLGYVYFLNGEYSQANQYLSETIQAGREIGAMLNTVAGYCILARMRANQGRLRDSYLLYQQAAEWIRETGEQHLGASSLIEMGIADVLCEWNELEAALEHVRRGLAYIHLWGKADDFILACITAARIHTALGEKADATEALEKASHSTRTYGVFPEAPQSLELAQVKIWQNQGDFQAAERWMASVQERLETGDPFRFPNEATHIARARVFIAQDKTEEAITLLSRLETAVRSEQRMGRVIEILMLKARALQQAGSTEQALLRLEECLELAEPEGYVRIFLDEGEAMCSLLDKLSRKQPPPLTNPYIGRLLDGYHRRQA